MLIPDAVAVTIIFLFCVQAILFCFLLLLKKPHRQANIFLVLVLAFFSLAAFNLALFYLLILIHRSDLIPYLQLELLFGLGPSIYLYTKSVADPGYKISKKEYWHFLPVIVEFVYYRTSFFREGATSFTNSQHSFLNRVFLEEQWAGTISVTIYVICSLKLLLNYQVWLKNYYANLDRRTLKWLMTPIVAYASFWMLWHLIRLTDLFVYADHYRNYYFYPMFIILSIITCWIGFEGYIKSQVSTVGFIGHNEPADAPLTVLFTSPSSTGNFVRETMEREKLYLDIDLNMDSFSNKLGINPKQISKIINSELNMNFHEFVNQYRVVEFIERLKQPDHNLFTIWGHALESGFASKSTFNHIFKKYTGLTPKEYYHRIRIEYNNMSEKMIPDD